MKTIRIMSMLQQKNDSRAGLQQLLLVCCLLFIPLCTFAYTSVIAKPVDARVVLPIANPQNTQDYFGRLDDYPHTFDFEIKETQAFKASVFVPDDAVQKNDIALMLVKAERRGVSEVGRTNAKTESWGTVYSHMYAESFRSGGFLEGSLEPGWYKLEVSSPNNEGKYRVVWGSDSLDRSYFENVRALFEVKKFLDNSRFGALLSPLLYVPILIVLIITGFVVYRRKKQ